MYGPVLPKSDTDLAVMLRRHCTRMDTAMMAKRTLWLLAWYYMNGYRRFNVYNPETGRIIAHQLDDEGNLEYQSQELLYYLNQVVGRVQGMDLRPWVVNEGQSLGTMRDRALTQIILDSVVNDREVNRIKEEFTWTVVCLGFAGCQGHIMDHATIGLTSNLEVIPPNELMPFPLVEHDITKVRGLIRQRMVPLQQLRDLYGPKVTRNLEDVEWYSQMPEDSGHEDSDNPATTMWSTNNRQWMDRSGHISGGESPEIVRTVRVRELWTYGAGGTVAEYALCSGDYCIDRKDLRGLETYCPIGWARAFNNGTFHGAGLFEIMYSQHRQLEMMTKALFTNIRDIDRYGIVVLPQGQMNQNQVLRDVGRGLRALFWDPDVVGDGFRPFAIQPHNAGDTPGKVAAFAREGLQLLNPVRDLAEEKGRIDSSTGLQALQEDLNRNMTTITSAVHLALGDTYRAIAQKAAQNLLVTRRAIPVNNLTLDLAGAIIDFDSGEVSFRENPVPSVSRLRFTVREASPRSSVARKQEAYQLWEGGIETDPLNFRLFALREGLDFALYMDDIRGAVEAGTRAILSLYNDGQTPGPLMMTPYTVDGELFARQLTGFMKGPYLQVAATEVIEEFYRAREWAITEALGQVLPNAVPNPDDLAMISEMPGLPMLPEGVSPDPRASQGVAPNASQSQPAGPPA